MPDEVGVGTPGAGGPPLRAARITGSWGEEAALFLRLATPMVISRLGVAAMGLVDGIMLAHFGSESLATLGLADTLVSRVLEVAMVFVTAGLPLAAQARLGDARSARQVGHLWRLSLVLALVAGALGLLIGLMGAPLLRALGQPPALADAAGPVLWVLSLGIPSALFALASAGLLEALGRSLGVSVVVVLANGLNVALNWLFIQGHGSLPALGTLGSALSTTLVRLLLAWAMVALIWSLPAAEKARYGLRQGLQEHFWSRGREQRARGWSGAGNVAVMALLTLGLPLMAGWIGTDAVTAFTALWLVLTPMLILAWGLGDAAGLRIAALKAHAPEQLRRTAWRLAGVLLAVGAAASLPYVLGADRAVRWAAHDPALVAQVLPLLPVGLLTMVANAMGALYNNMLRSLGELRRPFWVYASTGLLLWPLAWAWAFPGGAGLLGLLGANAALAVVRAVALALLYDRQVQSVATQHRPRPHRRPSRRVSKTTSRPPHSVREMSA